MLNNIQVNYFGFTPEAQSAFQFAADIWESLIEITHPIVIDTEFADLGDGKVLASSGPTVITQLVGGGLPAPTFFADALANQLLDEDVNPQWSEITVRFNNNPTTNFYFGIDGTPSPGQFDFTSVALHEIGHGLGFFSSFTISPGESAN